MSPKIWRALLTLAISCHCAQAQPYSPTPSDLDGDGIPDAFESELLEQFAPVVYADQLYSGPTDRVPVPCDPSWFLKHVDATAFGTTYLNSPTPSQLLAFVRNNRDFAPNILLPFHDQGNRWGFSQVDPLSWDEGVKRHYGVFGRVWRPWSDYPNLYSVQYFMMFTANAPVFRFYNVGEHDGDWLCLDYCVDTGWPGAAPFIRHAVYHNHGKQILLTRESLQFEAGHPIAYLEPQVQEPWPNPSDNSGYDSWPDSNGFAKNWLWQLSLFPPEPNEEMTTARHSGRGHRYALSGIRNLGERYEKNKSDPTAQDVFLPVAQDIETAIALEYPGGWGAEGDQPSGPAFNNKQWRREFTYSSVGDYPSTACPLSAGEDPIRPNLDRTMRFQDEPYGGCEAEDPGYLYSHCFHYFLPIAYVWKSYPGGEPWWGGDGRQFNPYRSIPKAVDGVAAYGVLRIGAGTYSGAMTISKPMVIETYNGPVTIGQ